MKWQESKKVPDSTYFRTGDAEPTIEADGSITILNGQGSRRSSWGAPQVNTTVLIDDCDFLAVLVGFSHKHGGSQFYRYYIPGENHKPARRTWGQLTDDERGMVLAAYNEKAPHWARTPGKLSTERKAPTHTKFTAYKVMRKIDDSHFLSLYDDTEWELGKRKGQKVGDQAVNWGMHSGGYYVHNDQTRIVTLWDDGQLGKRDIRATHVLVECECYGRTAEFSSGKMAVTYCTPVSVIREV